MEGAAPCAFRCSSCAFWSPWSCACRIPCWSLGIPRKRVCLWRPPWLLDAAAGELEFSWPSLSPGPPLSFWWFYKDMGVKKRDWSHQKGRKRGKGCCQSEDLLQFYRGVTWWGILVFQPWLLPRNTFIVHLNLKEDTTRSNILCHNPDWVSLWSFLTLLLFLLLLPSFCAVGASLLFPSCCLTAEDLLVLERLSRWFLDIWGTFESRLRWIFTSRDLGNLWVFRELRGVFSRCFWVVLGGTFVSFCQTMSEFDLLQLILIGGAGDSWSGCGGLCVGQGQEFGYCTPQDGQWPYKTSATSDSDPAFRFSCDACLEVLLSSFLVSHRSLFFLLGPIFVLTLGLTVKQGSPSNTATTFSHLTQAGGWMLPAFAEVEVFVGHECLWLQLVKPLLDGGAGGLSGCL